MECPGTLLPQSKSESIRSRSVRDEPKTQALGSAGASPSWFSDRLLGCWPDFGRLRFP